MAWNPLWQRGFFLPFLIQEFVIFIWGQDFYSLEFKGLPQEEKSPIVFQLAWKLPLFSVFML